VFTRCPHCQTVHVLNASLIARAGGSVSCGRCTQDFNAVSYLFDHWPDSKSQAAKADTQNAAPVLGHALVGEENNSTISADRSKVLQVANDPNRNIWIAVFALLLLITLTNLAWTFRVPLLQDPQVRQFLADVGALDLPTEQAFRDPGKFYLVSRDMHKHPTRTGMLAMSFTFVNRADRVQAYPRIEVIIRDISNTPIAAREFDPAEYLPVNASLSEGLAPNVHLPVLLEFVDPGADATGFELMFH
jgi:predicted Zn finger-like uncharacterized protein